MAFAVLACVPVVAARTPVVAARESDTGDLSVMVSDDARAAEVFGPMPALSAIIRRAIAGPRVYRQPALVLVLVPGEACMTAWADRASRQTRGVDGWETMPPGSSSEAAIKALTERLWRAIAELILRDPSPEAVALAGMLASDSPAREHYARVILMLLDSLLCAPDSVLRLRPAEAALLRGAVRRFLGMRPSR